MTTANLGSYDLKTLLDPARKDLIKTMEDAVAADQEMIRLLAKMSPADQTKYAPLVRHSIETTQALIRKNRTL